MSGKAKSAQNAITTKTGGIDMALKKYTQAEFAALPANGKGRIALTMCIPIAANIGGMATLSSVRCSAPIA